MNAKPKTYTFSQPSLIIAVAALIAFSAGFGYMVGFHRVASSWMMRGKIQSPSPSPSLSASPIPTQIGCTLEAKICPDGSAVGRQGPNCEFAACPSSPSAPAEKRSPVNCCTADQMKDGYACVPEPSCNKQIESPDTLYSQKYVCYSPDQLAHMDELNCTAPTAR